MGASRTAAGISPQLLSCWLFLITTAELAWGDNPCRVQTSCETYTNFSLQLRWLKSAQFAGFYAALEMGYWRDECLQVYIYPRTSNVDPEHLGVHHADAAIPHYL